MGFNASTISEEYNLSHNLVDILSFDNKFLDCDVAQRMIFKGKRSGIIHNSTMEVDPGYKCNEKFFRGVQCYMMQSKDFTSSISCKLKTENNEIVSLNGQRITYCM